MPDDEIGTREAAGHGRFGKASLQEWGQKAVELSLDHVRRGGIPFSALVVDAEGTAASGVNRVIADSDPTAHAEIVAIRQAGVRTASAQMSGSVLIASGEPCGLCYLATIYAGIRHVFFVVSSDEAAQHGFDYRDSYEMLARPRQSWPINAAQLVVPEATKPFEEFTLRTRQL
ncbi:nucleoside deaminase [Saccharopolyspora pogona]|uniref:nucleoside deaminase n=1 Tax=Saccharopolyspora pogona TaxID=333966 RepID=UPI001688EBC5|nr:nucleoside deaminase [Saccharopolyspora pogona]